MEVDIQKFNTNIDKIQKYVGNKILMPVIKANAYGTYINKNLEVINKFDIVAVAIVDEAVKESNDGTTAFQALDDLRAEYEIDEIKEFANQSLKKDL